MVRVPRLALLHLPPAQAAAVALLDEMAAGHPGVRIVTPHHRDEPWRASVEEDTVPGDERQMILTAYLPSELLAKLGVLFPAPVPDPGPG